jgi:hypothetical protein
MKTYFTKVIYETLEIICTRSDVSVHFILSCFEQSGNANIRNGLHKRDARGAPDD